MAQQKAWSIPFVAMDGISYEIGIYAEGHTAQAQTLMGGAQPFVTEEDASEDILLPVRTQSGYITIVADRDTWMQVIKQGEYVELRKDGDTVEWCGYISKEAYNGDVFEPKIEYQIPVHCILSHLKSYKFKVSPFDAPTFAYILAEAFAKMPKGFPSEMWWNEDIAVNEVPIFIDHRFQRGNFYDFSKDYKIDETVMSDSTYLDVVGEICKYFGITLLSQGENIIFTIEPGTGIFYKASTQDLTEVETDGAQAIRKTGEFEIITKEIGDLTYKSNDNSESILMPINNIKISGDINYYDDFNGAMPVDVIRDFTEKHNPVITHEDNNVNRIYWRRSPLDIIRKEGITFEDWLKQRYYTFENGMVAVKLYDYYNLNLHKTMEHHKASVVSKDVTKLDEVPEKVDYDWHETIEVFIQHTQTAEEPEFLVPVLGYYNRHTCSFPQREGGINIYYKASETGGAFIPGSLQWKLRIGNKYWNGTSWTENESYFWIDFKNKESKTNRRLGDGFNGVKGVVIPINENLHGDVSLELYQMDVWDPEVDVYGIIYFEELRLSYVRKDYAKEFDSRSEVTEEANTELPTIDDYSQSCAFSTSSAYIHAFSDVLDFGGNIIQNFMYAGRYEVPEKFRLSVIRNRRNRPLSVLDVTVNCADIDRTAYIPGDYGFSDYSILSVAHDWRESNLKVKLIEK